MRFMKMFWVRYGTLAVYAFVLSAPQSVSRAGDAASAPRHLATDVALAEDGLLTVRAVTSAGKPAPGRHVRLLADGKEVVAVTTDASGILQVSGLREGVHEIAVDSSSSIIRIWDQETAPPHAEASACVVCPDESKPACPPQNPHRGPLKRAFASYPLATTALIGAGLGAAIAIPIAVSQKPASP